MLVRRTGYAADVIIEFQVRIIGIIQDREARSRILSVSSGISIVSMELLFDYLIILSSLNVWKG